MYMYSDVILYTSKCRHVVGILCYSIYLFRMKSYSIVQNKIIRSKQWKQKSVNDNNNNNNNNNKLVIGSG